MEIYVGAIARYYQTVYSKKSILNDDLIDDIDTNMFSDADSYDYVISLGLYDFDLEVFERFSNSTKKFILEEIVEKDDTKKVRQLDRLVYSDNVKLLMKEGTDVEELLNNIVLD